ncbi:hypothetical protein JNW88_26405 [Micromonospora sp. ATA32]|nr:hypothetical protein [Micromonospora sp. ATA32]
MGDPAASITPEAATNNSFLGFGFNVFGTTNLATSTTLSLVKTTLVAPDDNVVISPVEEKPQFRSYTFNSRDEVTEHLAASAQLSYSGVVFSGEFSAKYQSDTSSDTQQSYGLYEASRPLSLSRLADLGVDQQASTFFSSNDVTNLPDTFSADTAQQFFRIFRRFGTHVVTEVTLGGRLTAHTTSYLSSSMDSKTAAMNMSMEYDALFSSGSAQAQAEWSKLGQSWTSQRAISFEIAGGDPSPLAGFAPAYNASAGNLVANWMSSVPAAPAVVSYALSPLSILFDGPTADAVDKAIAAYLGALIRVEAWASTYPRSGPLITQRSSCMVTLPGQLPQFEPPWSPPGPSSDNTGGVTAGSALTSSNGTRTQAATASGFITEQTAERAADTLLSPIDDGVQGSFSEPNWLWVALLDPDAPDFAKAALNKLYYLNSSTLFDTSRQIDADVTTARATIHSPLVTICGVLANTQAAISGSTALEMPPTLRELVNECGFDLEAALTPTQQVIALVGAAGATSPAIVTATPVSELQATVPTAAVGQYLDRRLTMVDGTGNTLSPVTS